MEIKAKLNKPCTKEERMNFIVRYNHNLGYVIKESKEAIEAFDLTKEEKELKEKERIQTLSLTKREVFLALYEAKQVTPDMVKAQITDPKELIEFEYANEYFRGNPLIDLIGEKLGYTSEDLDYLFLNKELPTLEENSAVVKENLTTIEKE